MDECLACDLTHGRRPLPGGLIHRAGGWRVEHSVGPLGLGTLIVKPERHVIAVADLSYEEAAALGRLLWQASAVASVLVGADQVYNCLWSHANGSPVHIHYLIQPVTKDQMVEFGCYGPILQTAMFAIGQLPAPDLVEAFCERARTRFSDPSVSGGLVSGR